MIVGDLDIWMATFAGDLVSVPETNVEERDKIISTHKQILFNVYIQDKNLYIKDEAVNLSGVWVQPDYISIANSGYAEKEGTWSQPNELLDIGIKEDQKSNKWFDPILWGE